MLGQKITLGAAGNASAPENYWYWRTNLSNQLYCYGVTTDNDNNIYLCGERESGGAYDGAVISIDTDGNTLNQRTWNGGSVDVLYDIVFDGTNNLYAVGWTNGTGSGYYAAWIQKLNLNLSHVWTKTLDGSDHRQYYGVDVDSSGRPYCVGQDAAAGQGGYDFVLDVYNADGTTNYQRRFGTSSNTQDDSGYGIALNSSDIPYLVGRTTQTYQGSNEGIIVRVTLSGNSFYNRYVGTSSGSDRCWDVAHKSNGWHYVVGETSNSQGGTYDGHILEFDNVGTLQTQRYLGSNSGNDFAKGVACDSQGNVYVVTQSYNGAVTEIGLFKFSTPNLTLQWRRAFVPRVNGTQKDMYVHTIRVDSNDNLIIAGHTLQGPGTNQFFAIKYPSDGSLQGIYTNGTEDIWIRSPLGFNVIQGTLTYGNANMTQGNLFDSTASNPLSSQSQNWQTITTPIT